nr:HlyD family efflux transporter periplasmic adaptor subunit [Thauera linaloolentis]
MGESRRDGTGKLPPLREELLLHRAPHGHDGAPAWTLEDPGRGRFFQIGWAEAEMLARWHLGGTEAVAEAIGRETTLRLDAGEVAEFSHFLDTQGLLQLRGPQALERYAKEAGAQRRGHWLTWLLHHYLFFRIPLLRPDAFLERTLPWVRRVFLNRRFAAATMAAGLAGLLLAARQWDAFVHTFLHFFTLEGALIAAAVLACTKIIHELGHAYTAKLHGCRVSTMGVAFMVMWPVLYTDTSGAWRLASRRRRLSIGAAGMLAETALAAWATLAWSFLPDGMLRSAAFMLATTTWLLTLAVNLNPLMRFDGYFLLADTLNVPNLQERAFTLARWRLREWLFGLGDDKPESFAPWRERAMLAYAFCTWVYRFFLFLGIALLVYHMAFKLLGILLFVIEIFFFVLRPMFKEFGIWMQRLLARKTRWNHRSLGTLALLVAAVLLAALPWHTRIQAPALARAAEQARLVSPSGARVAGILVGSGEAVEAGAAVFMLEAPDLDHELRSLRQRIGILEWQSGFHAMRMDTAASIPVAQSELRAARIRLAELERQRAQLAMAAPFAGVLVELAEPLAEGEWVGAGEWLGTLAAPDGMVVEAYATEDDVHRLRAGNAARFLPDDPGLGALKLRVVEIAAAAAQRLNATPELASPNGGAIAAVPAPARVGGDADGGGWVPEQAVYRILLAPPPDAPAALPRRQALRGTVLIDGEAESPLARLWRQSLAVILRESGF